MYSLFLFDDQMTCHQPFFALFVVICLGTSLTVAGNALYTCSVERACQRHVRTSGGEAYSARDMRVFSNVSEIRYTCS